MENKTPMDKDTQLPAELLSSIERKAQHYSSYKPDKQHYMQVDKGRYLGYIAGATEYATKLHQAQQDNKEWKEECERLAKVAEHWQQEYYKLNPPLQPMKIDNNPIA